jgi:hypothetical protein
LAKIKTLPVGLRKCKAIDDYHLLKVHKTGAFEYVGELVNKASQSHIITNDDLVETLSDKKFQSKNYPDMKLGQDLAFLEAAKINLEVQKL